MGLATFVIGLLPTYEPGRPAGPGPAGVRPHRPGPGLRRRMGRRDPDELRARPVEVQGQVHRHRPGRLPRRAAAGQPRLPRQRAPRRRTGLARAVPGQHRAGRRRPDHPRPRSPSPRSSRRSRTAAPIVKSPDHRGHQDRLAQHPARHRPAHRRDRRLRRVHHLHDLLPPHRAARRQDPDPGRPVHRLRPSASSPPMAWARLTDRIGRRPLYIWSCAFAVLFGIPMFLLVNTGVFIAHHRHRRDLLRRLPELPRRRPGRLVPGTVPRQAPRLRRLAGLPDLGHGLRLHPVRHHPAVRQLRLDGPGTALQLLRRRSASGPPSLTRETWGQARAPARRRGHQKHPSTSPSTVPCHGHATAKDSSSDRHGRLPEPRPTRERDASRVSGAATGSGTTR